MTRANKKVKQTMTLFAITFFVTLIIVTYFIKSFSPNVDVEIGGISEEKYTLEEDETNSDIKKAIDDRLRWIQLEDNMPGATKRENEESDNISNDTEQVKKAEKIANETETKSVNKQIKKITEPPIPLQQVELPKMSKVYVGSYSTIEQAIQAQNKLMSATNSVSPFVKEINGIYVLQAGSYANAQKAEIIAKEINALGFPTKVVKE